MAVSFIGGGNRSVKIQNKLTNLYKLICIISGTSHFFDFLIYYDGYFSEISWYIKKL